MLHQKELCNFKKHVNNIMCIILHLNIMLVRDDFLEEIQ